MNLIPTFDCIMEITAGVSGATAFELPECELYYRMLCTLRSGASIVEIGVEYGRSSSIMAQMAMAHGHSVTFIDPFVDSRSLASFVGLMQRIGLHYTLHVMRTSEVRAERLPMPVDFLLIDGSHDRQDIEEDCTKLLPRVATGGLVLAHDYGRDSLPDVYPVMNEHMTPDAWEQVEVAGTLGVWRRVR